MNDFAGSSSAAHRTGARKNRIQRFGPNGRLLGLTTEAAARSVGVGAVLWGMGIAQLRIARRLSGLGIPSLQAKLVDRDFSGGHFSHDGITLVQAAMDKLAMQQDVDSFLLVGNCAFANICLNTAIIDPRIGILALTNPFLTRRQTDEVKRWSFARNVFRLGKWMQLLHGRVDIRSSLNAARFMVTGKPRRIQQHMTAASRPARPEFGKDMILPDDLDDQLTILCDRGVQIYFACSKPEPALRFLDKHYRKTLRQLQNRGALTLSTIDTEVHLMGTNSEGALMHSESISNWLLRRNILNIVSRVR